MNTVAIAPSAKSAGKPRDSIDPRRDPEGWIRNNERITNQSDVAGWLALYADDAVFDAITDGVSDRIEGISALTEAIYALGAVFERFGLRVQKQLAVANENVIVNTWTGGFGGRNNQFGIEIWTLREDKVIRQQQYTYMDVLPGSSTIAKARALVTGELAIKLAVAKTRANRAKGRVRTRRS